MNHDTHTVCPCCNGNRTHSDLTVELDCDACNGTGKVEWCKACDGEGWAEKRDTLTESGALVAEPEQCDECDGTGRTLLGECHLSIRHVNQRRDSAA